MLAFLQDRSFAGRLVNALPHVSAPGLGTMAIGLCNKRIALYTDPDFIARVSLPAGQFYMEHEILGHFANAHIPRYLEFLSRYPKPEDRERASAVMQVAVDCATNSLLRRSKHFDHADKELLAFARWKHPEAEIAEDAPGGLVLPERYQMEDGKSFEYYLEELMKRSGLGNPRRTIEQDSYFDEILKGLQTIKDSHEKWPGSEGLETMSPDELHSLAHQLHNQTKFTLRKIVKEMRKQGHGTIPGNLTEWLDDYLSEPIVPWWEIFTSRIRTTRRTKPSRGIERPNRALLAMAEEDGTVLPAIGTTKKSTWRVFFLEDVSGSMGKEAIEIGRNELQNMLNMDSAMEVRWIQFDTQMTFDKVFTKGQKLPNEAWGRGGTDFNGAFEHVWKYIGNAKTQPDVVVVYTDGGAPAIDPKWQLPAEIPVIWCVTHDGCAQSILRGGYGEVIVCSKDQTEMWKHQQSGSV